MKTKSIKTYIDLWNDCLIVFVPKNYKETPLKQFIEKHSELVRALSTNLAHNVKEVLEINIDHYNIYKLRAESHLVPYLLGIRDKIKTDRELFLFHDILYYINSKTIEYDST